MQKLLLYLLLITFFTSCKKYLDKKPDAKLAFPETLDDFQALLSSNSINETVTPGILDLGTDDYFLRQSNYDVQASVNPIVFNAYTWESNIYNGSVNYLDWQLPYRNIYTANVVLEGLDKFTITDPAQQLQFNSIYGQALFQRAFMHFCLEEAFGQPFKPGSSNGDLGIPLKLTSRPEDVAVRSTVQKVFDQILSDLNTATSLLPGTVTSKNRATRASAFALLARACLVMQDYQKAGAFADSTLKYYNNLYNYNTLPANGVSITNNAVAFAALGPGNDINFETIYYSTMVSHGVIRLNSTSVDSVLFSTYNINDIRRGAFFRQQVSPNGPGVYFKGNYTGSQSQHFSGLAVDEIYLTRAECYARDNNKDLALKYLDTLLIKRWKTNTYTPATAVDAEDALRKILLERRKELLFRGIRWSDLRRLNQDPRFAVTIKRFVNGREYTLPPNDKKYTYPIPEPEIQKSGIPQNPR